MNIDEIVNSLSELKIDHNNLKFKTEMATIQAAKEISYTLRNFSGRQEHLESFINAANKFFDRYGTTNDNSLSEFVFAAICSKIIDEAGDFLLCRPDLNTWPQVRTALREKFGDKTDRHVLQQQFIYLTKHKNENIIDFLERLKITKMRLNLKINSDPEIAPATKMVLIDQNEITAITVLISNSNTELRTLLLLKNPRSIDEATALVINHSLLEQQVNLRHFHQPNHKNQHNHNPSHSNYSPRNHPRNQPQYRPIQYQTQNYPNFYQRPNNSYNNPFNIQKTPFPSQPINIQSREVPQRYPTNEQVFGKTINAFSPNNSHKPTNKTEPMSTSSRLPSTKNSNQPQRPYNHFQNRYPNNRKLPFAFEELTNVEIDHYDNDFQKSSDDNYDNHHCTDNYDCNYTDFPQHSDSEYFEEDYTQPQNFHLGDPPLKEK